MNGAKPVIGYIMMGGSASLETEMHRCLPEGIEMATTRVPFHNVSYRGLLEMIERIPEAARILSEAHPSVIAVTSFTGSCIKGQEIVNRVQQITGVPAVVPAIEFVSVLRALGAKRVALISGFDPELRLLEQVFFNENGIELAQTIELGGMQQADPFAFSQIDYTVITAAVEQADFQSVDAVLVDLPTFRMTPEICAAFARHKGLPVLSMVQVLLWSTFDKVGAARDGLYLSRYLAP